MREPQVRAIQLKDYAPPAFRVDTVDLDVDIRNDDALVRAKLEIRRNSAGPLVLDGDELELVSVALDGRPVKHEGNEEQLTIPDVPDACTLDSETRIVPPQNTKLEGLYARNNDLVRHRQTQAVRR